MCADFSAREQEIGEPQTRADLVEKGPRILDAFEIAIANQVGTLDPPDEIADEATGGQRREGRRLRRGAAASLEKRGAQQRVQLDCSETGRLRLRAEPVE